MSRAVSHLAPCNSTYKRPDDHGLARQNICRRANASIDLGRRQAPQGRVGGEVVSQADGGPLVLGVLTEALAGDHDRHGRFGDEVVRKGT